MTIAEQIRENCRLEFEARGREEGIALGVKQGMKQGVKKGMVKMITRQLLQRFGKLSDDAEQRIKRADEALLDTWATRILEASSLDEVFADS